MSPDPFSVLNIRPGATRDEVLAAYRREAKRTHPDQGGDADDFRQVRAAYLRLSDDSVRAKLEEQTRTSEELVELKITPAMARVGAIVRVPQPRWVQCTSCDGVGVAPKRRKACTRCEATGHVEESVHTHPFVLPCPRCLGTGFTGTECKDCVLGKRLVSLTTKVRLPKNTRSGQVFKVGGKPAFTVKIVGEN